MAAQQDDACDALIAQLAEVDSQLSQLDAEELLLTTLQASGQKFQDQAAIFDEMDQVYQQGALAAFADFEGSVVDELNKITTKLDEAGFNEKFYREGQDIRKAITDVKELLGKIAATQQMILQVRSRGDFDPVRTLNTLTQYYGQLKGVIGPYADQLPGVGAFLNLYGEALSSAATQLTKLRDLRQEQSAQLAKIPEAGNPYFEQETDAQARAKLRADLKARRDAILERIADEPTCDAPPDAPEFTQRQQIAREACLLELDVTIPPPVIEYGLDNKSFAAGQRRLGALAAVDRAEGKIREAERKLESQKTELADSETGISIALAKLTANAPGRAAIARIQQRFPGFPGRVSGPRCAGEAQWGRSGGVESVILGNLATYCSKKYALPKAEKAVADAEVALEAARSAKAEAERVAQEMTEADEAAKMALRDARELVRRYEECLDRQGGDVDISGQYKDESSGAILKVNRSGRIFTFLYETPSSRQASDLGIQQGHEFFIGSLIRGRLDGVTQAFYPPKFLEDQECELPSRQWIDAEALIWDKGEWLSLTAPIPSIDGNCNYRRSGLASIILRRVK